jgi:hypothetical protein
MHIKTRKPYHPLPTPPHSLFFSFSLSLLSLPSEPDPLTCCPPTSSHLRTGLGPTCQMTGSAPGTSSCFPRAPLHIGDSSLHLHSLLPPRSSLSQRDSLLHQHPTPPLPQLSPPPFFTNVELGDGWIRRWADRREVPPLSNND